MQPQGTSPYLESHHDLLAELLDVLGEEAPTDEDGLVRWMERRWLGAEHGPGDTKPVYPEEVRRRAWPLLQRLDLVDRVDPREDSYDEILVMGAAGIGLYRRLGLVRDSGVAAGTLTILAGQRPHSGLARDGGLDEYADPAGRFAAAPGWAPPPALLRQHQLLHHAGVDPLVAAQVVVPSETDMARLLLHKLWPLTRLTSVEVEDTAPPVVNELGARTVVWEHYQGAPRIPSVRLLNSAPVERRTSAGQELPARPTSRSSIREWVGSWGDARPAHVLVVVNQPHLSRVANDIGAELALAGVESPALEVVGCEVLQDSVDVNLVLGEIPARINSERRTGPTG